MNARYVTFLIPILATVACKDPITPEKIAAINVGDSQESVFERIGKPYNESKIDKPFDNGSGATCVKSGAWFHGSGFLIVHFDEKKKVCTKPVDAG